MTKRLVRKQHPGGGHHDCDESPDCLACQVYLKKRETAVDRYAKERCEKSPTFKAEYEKAKEELTALEIRGRVEQAFSATPEELGRAAVEAAREKSVEDKLEDRRPKGDREQVVTNLTIAMGSMLRSLRLSLYDRRDAEEILAEVMLKSMENEGVWVAGEIKRPEREEKPERVWRDRGGNRRVQK